MSTKGKDSQAMLAVLIDADNASAKDIENILNELTKYGDENSLSIHAMHEDIFNSMHRI